MWNWQAAFLPDLNQWQTWLCRAAAQMLREARIGTAQLVRTTTGEPPQAISLDRLEPLRIGRAAENEVVLPPVTVGRQHAELRWEGDGLWLVDLGSSLGTVVNGVKAQPNLPVELVDGGEFVIFPYRFQVKLVREWVAVEQVTIGLARQSIRDRGAFLADHAVGWSRFLLRAHGSPERICLAAEDALLDALTGRLLAPLDEAAFALPGSRRAWREVLVLGALAEANRGLLSPGHLTLVDGCPVDAPGLADVRGIEYRAVLDLAGVRGAISCFLPFAALAALQECWKGQSRPTLAGQAPVCLSVSGGRVPLTLAEQRAIEAGDVILYEPSPALLFPGGAGGSGNGREGGNGSGSDRGWLAEQINDRQFVLKKKFDRSMQMTDTAEPLTDIGDLTINLEILIGQKEISLRDAGALAPGAVIDLERDPNDPVRLAVNGRTIGKGQLVTVDGRWGVRIVEWCGGQA